MTDIASLQIKIDSTQTKEAADNLNMLGTASKSAEGSVNSAGKTWVKASSAAGQLRMAEAGAAKAATDMATATAGAGTAAAKMARDAQQSAAGLNKVTVSAGAQRAGLQQLGYQLGDVATMFSMGAKPMQIFASQGGQVVQAISLMTGGASRLGAFLTGPWGIALSVGAIAMAPLIGKLWETVAGANAATNALQNLIEKRRQELADKTRIADADRALNGLLKERAELEAYIARQPRNPDGTAKFSYRQQKDLREINRQIAEGRGAINAELDETRNAGAIRAGLEAMSASAKKLSETQSAAAGSSRAHTASLSAEEKALNKAATEAESFANSLNAEASRIGKTAVELKRMEVATAKAAAPTAALKSAIEDAGRAWEKAYSADAVKSQSEQIDLLKEQAKWIGLTTEEREKAEIIYKAEIKAAEEERQGLDDLAASTRALAQEQVALVDLEAKFKAEAEAARQLDQQVDALAGSIGSLGGIGGKLGGLLGALGSGNPIAGLAGMGGLGSLAAIALKPSLFAGLAGDYTTGLAHLGIYGNLGAGLGGGLAGAGIGSIIGGLIPGGSGTGGTIGGAIGGVAGSFIPIPGGQIIGSVIGSALGSLVGGLLGSTKWGRVSVSGSGVGATEGNKGAFEDAALQAGNGVIDALNQIAEQLGGTLGTFNNIAIGVRDGKWRVNTTGTSLKTGNGAIDFGEDGQAAVAYAVSQAIKMGAIDGLRATTATLLQASGDFQEQLQKALTLESVFAEIERQADPMKYELDQLAKKFAQINQILAEGNATAAEYQQVADYQATLEQQIRDQYAAEAAAKAEQARQEALARANEKLALEARLLVAQGDALGALAKQRQIELSQIDAANRALLQEIFAAEDLASAKQNLADAYARESGELQQTIDRMAGFSASLRDVRDNIFAGTGNGQTYNQALAKLMQVGGLAGAGDETALGSLGGAVNDFLGIAKSRAGSSIDFQRAQALAAGYLDKAIGFTDSAGNIAQRQLDEMKTQVSALIELNETAMTVSEAINRLVELQGGGAADGGGGSQSAAERARARMAERIAAMEERMAELAEGGRVQIRLQERLQRFFEQLSPDGLGIRIRTDADSPIDVTVSA